jgi:hypothetical protein
MPGQVTTRGTRVFLQSFFGRRTDLIPNQLWIALIGEDEPTIQSTGSDIAEIDFDLNPSYTRAQFQNVQENWTLSGYDTILNAKSIDFPVANENWGDVFYFGICTSETGGDLLAYGDLASSQNIIEGDRIQIDIGGLSFTVFNPAYEGT